MTLLNNLSVFTDMGNKDTVYINSTGLSIVSM